jgi:hypothetical protein
MLYVVMILLAFAGSMTAPAKVRIETLIVASVGLIALGVAVGRRTTR